MELLVREFAELENVERWVDNWTAHIDASITVYSDCWLWPLNDVAGRDTTNFSRN